MGKSTRFLKLCEQQSGSGLLVRMADRLTFFMQIYRRLTIGAHLVLPTRAHTTLDLSHRTHSIKIK